MRPFEILSCLFAASAIAVVLFLPTARRLVTAAMVVLTLAIGVQLAFEGSHWQLIPLYLSVSLLFVLVIAGRRWPRWMVLSSAITSLLLVIGCVVLSWLMPMFRLPVPTGKYAVGTRIFHLVDTSRTEDAGFSPSGKRELMIQAWYPASADSSSQLAMYQRRKEVTLRASYRSVLKTHSYQDAPVLGGGPYPVLIYSPSWNGERTEGTYQMEELASHGFIVVAVDHTFYGGLVEFPDGHVADSRNAPNIGNFEHSSIAEQWQLGGKYVRIEAQDDIFVLDSLQAMNQNPASPLFHQLDMNRVGAMGFSIGGAAAVQMAYQDPRVKAVLNMDGWEFGDAEQHFLAKPMMVIYEDKRGVLPEEPRSDPSSSPEAAQQRMNWQFSLEDYSHVTGSMKQYGGYLLFIAGTHHVDFTDRSLFSPIHRWTGRGALAPVRAHAIVNAYTLAFFSHCLNGKSEPLLDAGAGNPALGKSIPFQEVEYQHFDGVSASAGNPNSSQR